MTTVESVPPAAALEEFADRAVELRVDRTVDRTLVHKDAVSEVFLTDHAGNPAGFTAAAQLPPDHPYWGDHVARTDAPDPLLLLECCRQAETLGVHAHLGAPPGTKFVLQRWWLDLPALPGAVARGRATPVAVAVTPDVTRSGASVRGASYVMDVAVGGRPVGSAGMTVAYVPAAAYSTVRTRRRGSPPPMSDDPDLRTTGRVPVEPRTVGRRDPRNVVLERPSAGPDGVLAHVLPAMDHPSLFDHPQDHLPGMTVMEAVRQAAVLSAGVSGAGAPEYLLVTGLDAEFHRYTELDRITRVHAGTPRPTAGGAEVTATVTQDGTPTATVGVRMAVVSAVTP